MINDFLMYGNILLHAIGAVAIMLWWTKFVHPVDTVNNASITWFTGFSHPKRSDLFCPSTGCFWKAFPQQLIGPPGLSCFALMLSLDLTPRQNANWTKKVNGNSEELATGDELHLPAFTLGITRESNEELTSPKWLLKLCVSAELCPCQPICVSL